MASRLARENGVVTGCYDGMTPCGGGFFPDHHHGPPKDRKPRQCPPVTAGLLLLVHKSGPDQFPPLKIMVRAAEVKVVITPTSANKLLPRCRLIRGSYPALFPLAAEICTAAFSEVIKSRAASAH